MSIYAVLDGDPEGGDQVATNDGWADYCDWVDDLDSGVYPDIAHLDDWGWCQNLPELETQLRTAIEETPPEDEDTLDVANGLLAIITGRGDAEVITITNGVGPNSEEGEQDD